MAKAVKVLCKTAAPTVEFAPSDDTGDFLGDLRRRLRVSGGYHERNHVVFDMAGVDASIANAFRRTLLAEVPTMAMEKVFLIENTSVIQDEVLCHRLGLIPLAVDADLFEYMTDEDEPNDKNTVVMRLHVRCPSKRSDGADIMAVYSGALEWVPQGGQAQQFARSPIRPVHDDILIAKLKPGQIIQLEAHVRKGVGKTHAKWSPVSTAYYRLLPEVTIVDEVRDADADELVRKCPMNVFDIEDMGGGRRRAVVARPRDCSMCRECIREPGWEERVKLARVSNHFIFSVESVGALPARTLVVRAAQQLQQKCQAALTALDVAEGVRAVGVAEGEEAAEEGAEEVESTA